MGKGQGEIRWHLLLNPKWNTLNSDGEVHCQLWSGGAPLRQGFSVPIKAAAPFAILAASSARRAVWS